MKKINGKLIILLVLLLFVVSIGAVSAADNADASVSDNTTVIQDTQINEDLDNNILLGEANENPILNGSDLTKYYKGDENYVISLTNGNGTPLANQKVKVTINSVTYDMQTNNNGIISLPIGLNAGSYPVNSSYNGSYGYATLKNTITVQPTIYGADTTLYYRNGTGYAVTVLDKTGARISQGTVEMNINGVIYTVAVTNGVASLPIGLNAGKYTITAANMYNGEMTSNTITVKPTISGKDTTVYYRNGSGYVATVLDGQGKLAQTGTVQMNINGILYTVAVTNGEASLPIGLSAGTYTITAKNLANGEMTSNKITVKSTISGKDTTLYYRNGSGYVATVLDSQGNPAKTGSVEMNINGVIYNTAVTNGTATLPIGLNAGTYTITAKNLANGEMTSNKITVKTTIVAEDQYIYYHSGESYKVTILDGQGNLTKTGTVEMNVNGVIYNVTVTNGTASLPIGLNAGTYMITTKNLANNETSSNTLTVVTNTIVGKDTTIVYKSTKYTVYVFDNAGKPLNGTNVTFKVNGAEYNITAVNGTASLPIGLEPNKYSITATNLVTKESITNKITVIPSIYADDVVMSYGDGSTWDILILGADGKPAAGEQVSVIYGSTLTMSQTGSDGMYHYKINLPSGYIYTLYACHGNALSSYTDYILGHITVYP